MTIAPELLLLVFLVSLCLIPDLSAGAEVAVLKSAGAVEILLPRSSEQCWALTHGNEVQFRAEQAGYVRVYTRLRWNEGMSLSASYVLRLNSARETSEETLVAQKSPTALGRSGEAYGKWRSFFVRVPRKGAVYRLRLVSAESDTVAVRFAVEAPKPWLEITPSSDVEPVMLKQDTILTAWHKVAAGDSLTYAITGPLRLQVMARLELSAQTREKKEMELAVSSNGERLARAKASVTKSRFVSYTDKKSVKPSTMCRIRLAVPAGEHLLSVQVQAGEEATSIIRVLGKK